MWHLRIMTFFSVSRTWAGVGVALAHHDAAHGDQRGSGEPKLLCSQHGGDSHVTTGTQLPVHLCVLVCVRVYAYVRVRVLVGLGFGFRFRVRRLDCVNT